MTKILSGTNLSLRTLKDTAQINQYSMEIPKMDHNAKQKLYIRSNNESNNENLFEKILVTDEQVLRMLTLNAHYAQQAACLQVADHLGGRIYAGFPKNLQPSVVGSFQQLIIYFRRGEMSYKKWRSSIWWAVKYDQAEGAFVEDYFYKEWVRARTRFLAHMKILEFEGNTFQNSKSLFTFTGSGRGGVYAVFAALDFKETYGLLTKPTVVTFGLPRVGNLQFAQYVHDQLNVYRVTYADDWIPSSPSSGRYADNNENFKIPYVPLEIEYWIPLQEECECISRGFSKIPQTNKKYPKVFMCYDRNSLAEHPECNAKWRERRKQNDRWIMSFDYHLGPYFGYMMGQCPSQDEVKN
ncbi:hypothetical protein G9A89_012556 [Geosiphon pyriformis]|nr:hypothetical protein G9A89_012556 [Geosiphon pyriformis]